VTLIAWDSNRRPGRLSKSNGSLPPGGWLQVTAYTPGSAPGPTLGNEYRRTLPLLFYKFTLLTYLLTYLITGVSFVSIRLREPHNVTSYVNKLVKWCPGVVIESITCEWSIIMSQRVHLDVNRLHISVPE